MKRVESQIMIYAPTDILGQEIFQVDWFPRYMENVKEVKIRERKNHRQISAWRVELDGIELQWTQEERLDLRSGSMEFHLLEGDFSCFEGAWKFQGAKRWPHQGCVEPTVVSLAVTYDLGLPSFEEILGEILDKKVLRNSYNLLRALRSRVEEKG